MASYTRSRKSTGRIQASQASLFLSSAIKHLFAAMLQKFGAEVVKVMYPFAPSVGSPRAGCRSDVASGLANWRLLGVRRVLRVADRLQQVFRALAADVHDVRIIGDLLQDGLDRLQLLYETLLLQLL